MKAVLAVVKYLRESERAFASTVNPHLQQLRESLSAFWGAKGEIMNSWFSTLSQMQDHQLLMLCIIFSLLGITSVLKILQFLSCLPSAQTSDTGHSCKEHESQKEESTEETKDESPEETMKSGEMSPGPVHDDEGEEGTDDEISE